MEMTREELGLPVADVEGGDDFPVEEVPTVPAGQPRPSMDGPLRLVEGA